MRIERAPALAALLCTVCAALGARAESSQASRFGAGTSRVAPAQAPLAIPRLMLVTPIGKAAPSPASKPVPMSSTLQATTRESGSQAFADVLNKVGSLQFLSATLIPSRKEVVASGDGVAVTEVTPSLKIAPTFAGRTWGIAAVATF